MTLLVSATLSLEASPGLVLAWSWSWPGPVGGPVSYRRRSGWMLAEAPDSIRALKPPCGLQGPGRVTRLNS